MGNSQLRESRTNTKEKTTDDERERRMEIKNLRTWFEEGEYSFNSRNGGSDLGTFK